jgi:hypothetical protein
MKSAGSFMGAFWFAGWLFTGAFANLVWWKWILGIVVWPFYLGNLIQGRKRLLRFARDDNKEKAGYSGGALILQGGLEGRSPSIINRASNRGASSSSITSPSP